MARSPISRAPLRNSPEFVQGAFEPTLRGRLLYIPGPGNPGTGQVDIFGIWVILQRADLSGRTSMPAKNGGELLCQKRSDTFGALPRRVNMVAEIAVLEADLAGQIDA